jgi:alkylation response protein AidB-like acyl-CoA dehydrogenase
MKTQTTLSPLETVATVVQSIAANAKQVDSTREFPSKNIELLGENGLMGLLIAADAGGMGASAETFAGVVQKIGGACASTGMIFVMHSCAAETISKHHPEAGKLVKEILRGKHLTTLACSERGSGANFGASNTASQKANGGFILCGEKSFVTSGNYADSYVVSTRAVGSESSTERTMYLLAKDTVGVEFSGQWQGLGLRGNNSVSMKLSDCLVPELNQIGSQGGAPDIEMSTMLPRFLLGISAVYNGIAEAALLCAIEHVKTRVHAHTGEKLSAFPVLRNKIAQMKVQVDASMALMRSAAALWDADKAPALLPLLESKQIACRTAVEVAGLAMETCGGIAYSSALPIERHLRDAQAGIVMAPTNDILLDFIGKAVLGLE